MPGKLPEVVADVLDQRDAGAARTLLAEAIMAVTGTALATRVTVVAGRPDAVLRIHGSGFRPPAEQLPRASEVRRHPLYRYWADTGDAGPTLLHDAVRAGWQLSEETRRIFEELRISEHQLSLTTAGEGDYDGWTLVADAAIVPAQVRSLAEHARLVRGLDRHIEVLAALREEAPAEPDAGVRLTPREDAVLRLVYAGLTATAIAARLGASPRTVHKHQENLYRKLGVRDRLGAVLAAQQAGLLPTPGGEGAGRRLRG